MNWKHWRGRGGSETWAASAANGLTVELNRHPAGLDLRPWSWSLLDWRRGTHGALFGEGSFFATAAEARTHATAALRRMKPRRPRPQTWDALFFRPRPWRCRPSPSAPRKRVPKGKPQGWLLSDL